MNFKLRLQNKTTLITLITTLVAFIYQVLGLFGIVPKVSQDSILSSAMMVVNMLAMLGIIVDPTTKGICDSSQAMCYDCPKEDIES